jgi:hypothetical protein
MFPNWLRSLALFFKHAALSVLAITLFIALCLLYRSVNFGPAFDAVVFDSATNKPIEGAYIVSSWPTKKGFFVGINAGHVQFQEAKTKADGRFHIEAWGPKLFVDPSVATETPHLVVMKPGYQVLTINGARLNDINEFYGSAIQRGSKPFIRFNLDVLKDPAIDQDKLSYALSSMSLKYSDPVCKDPAVKNFVKYLVAERLRPEGWFKDCLNF